MTTTGTEATTPTPPWLRPFSMTTTPTEADDSQTPVETVRCPKCASTDTVVEYHPTAVSGYTCWDLIQAMRMSPDAAPDDVETALQTEHLCRACLACQYAWCEKTADAS